MNDPPIDPDKLNQAIAACRHAAEQFPAVAANHNNLGAALVLAGQFDQAVLSFQQALQLDPHNTNAAKNLGIAYARQGNHALAAIAFRTAIQLSPNHAQLHASLARSLHLSGDFQQAILAAQHALGLNPKLLKAYLTLALAYRAVMKLEESSLACQAAIAIDPDFADAHWVWSLNCLTLGDLSLGWAQHEWRHKSFAPRVSYSQPRWHGEPLEGRTILLHAEQGLGDTLHFVRYAPLVAARGGVVLLQCQPELVSLISRMPGIKQVFSDPDSPPPFDLHCPLFSLPFVFNTTLQNIPATVPYLTADPKAVTVFRDAHIGKDQNLKVGLVWAGRPTNANDRNRSIPLEMLAPIITLPGFTFYSLQKGDAASQAQSVPFNKAVKDLSNHLTNFDQTAAAVSALDLVITVDTAVAHLCGSIAIPAWVLIPFAPDWRWLLHRQDSPWYPTIRLFRQPAPAQWGPVIQSLKTALVEWV